jgi:hypothetical protein
MSIPCEDGLRALMCPTGFEAYRPFLRNQFLATVAGSSESLSYIRTYRNYLCVTLVRKIETRLRYFDSSDDVSRGGRPSRLQVMERSSVCSHDGRPVHYVPTLGRRDFKVQYICPLNISRTAYLHVLLKIRVIY